MSEVTQDSVSRSPGPRNRKEVRLYLYVSTEVNERLEAIADKLGLNKATAGALLVALGASAMEHTFDQLSSVPVPGR